MSPPARGAAAIAEPSPETLCRTNDVDTDQRRRTLNSARAMPLTEPFVEGEPEARVYAALGTHGTVRIC